MLLGVGMSGSGFGVGARVLSPILLKRCGYISFAQVIYDCEIVFNNGKGIRLSLTVDRIPGNFH